MGAARMIADLAADDSAPPLIALGDFNSTPDGFPGHEIDGAGDNAITFLMDSGMKTLLPNNSTTNTHLTFPSTQPNRVIDWILVSPTLTLMERRTIDSDLSDHRMVVGVIRRFQVE
jgi:endonuclease/exonuclease/phosphatase family metal-dependent hydrolase